VGFIFPIIEKFPTNKIPPPNLSRKYATIKMGKEYEKYSIIKPAMLRPNPI